MTSPQEAFGIASDTADRISRLPAAEVANYVGPWLSREVQSGDPLEALAATSHDRPGLADGFGGDVQALHVEFAVRVVRNLLGPNAQIMVGDQSVQ